MRIAELSTLQAIVCTPQTTIAHAAQIMRDKHVGDLIAADDSGGSPKPVGILTDRDIVVAVVAQGLDPTVILVGDIMTTQLLTVAADADPFEALATMRVRGVSRLPVVDDDGNLAGIVSAADLLGFVTQELAGLAGLRQRQTTHEAQLRH
jgi:CBS domain-containing protein